MVPKLINGDFVQLRNKTFCVVVNNILVCENGKSYSLKNEYGNWKHSGTNLLDIIKVYNNVSSFDEAKQTPEPVWVEPFPVLQNGDVVVLNNDEIYMKVDNCLVCQFEGFTYVDHYDENGENIAVDDEKWNIKKVYRKDKIKNFEIANIDEYLIWERS